MPSHESVAFNQGIEINEEKKIEICETYTWDKPSGTATEIDNVHCWIFGDNRNKLGS